MTEIIKTSVAPGQDEDFAALFEASQTTDRIREGEIVPGTVVSLTKEYAVVDVGYKSEAQIPISEFNGKEIKPGDHVEVLIEARENEAGLIQVSKEKADKLRIWDEISAASETDQDVEGRVIARVKGGLSVDIGVKAFLPGSQVDLRPVRNLDALIGQTFKFKIIKFNKKRGNIVLSRRVILEKERGELKKGTLERLKEGTVLDGVVKNITEYGAFIDLGGIDGLLHITDMSWGRVNHPSEMFQIGDQVRVKVLKFDPATERVSLGLKQTIDDPWKNASGRFPTGTRVRGKIVSITDYGAFVEIEEGVEGLVHISEMSWTRRVKHPSKVVNIGDVVEAVVLDIDQENKRISLGMKQIEPNPWTLLKEKYPIGSRIRGKIRNITDFGIFVGIEEGIDGLVHISDLSWTQRVKHPSELYKKGDEVEAVVLNIDSEAERFSLGIKQLTEDPWSRITDHYPIGAQVSGRVMKLTDFGAFVELEPGVEGLLHVSEFKPRAEEGQPEEAGKDVKEGDTLTLLVKDLDPADRKISLALSSGDPSEDFREYVKKQGSFKPSLGDLMKNVTSGK